MTSPLPPLLDALSRRHSLGPRYLGAPAPDRAQLESAAALALRAPDHGLLRPFRFVVVEDAQRERLAALFAADAQERGQSAQQVAQAHERAFNGPALLALVVRIRPDVPDVAPHEQWLSAGAALMNFLNGLHLQGYGAKVLSGPSVRNARIAAAFCADGETLAAWILAGTPLEPPSPRARPDAPPVLSVWR